MGRLGSERDGLSGGPFLHDDSKGVARGSSALVGGLWAGEWGDAGGVRSLPGSKATK